MANMVLRNGKRIGDGFRPYIVAEMNTSHNGKVETARQMIDQAVAAGCDCVKFQSWTEDTLYAKSYYDANPIARRMVRHYALSEGELSLLAEYCRESGIDFSSTPYAKAESDALADSFKAPFIKIASMDVNNLPFLHYTAQKGVPVVLSTGMADLEEIRRAVDAVFETGNRNLCLLHCVAEYPPDFAEVNLNNISLLRREFPECPIGLSDHTPGWEVAAAAVALGACLIEKHFTLGRKKPGWDNAMAMEPQEFRQLVNACGNVFAAMGSGERVVGPGELEQRKRMRRSVVAARDLAAGEVLGWEDLDFKRPGTGIPPEKAAELVGLELQESAAEGELITMEMLSVRAAQKRWGEHNDG